MPARTASAAPSPATPAPTAPGLLPSSTANASTGRPETKERLMGSRPLHVVLQDQMWRRSPDGRLLRGPRDAQGCEERRIPPFRIPRPACPLLPQGQVSRRQQVLGHPRWPCHRLRRRRRRQVSWSKTRPPPRHAGAAKRPGGAHRLVRSPLAPPLQQRMPMRRANNQIHQSTPLAHPHPEAYRLSVDELLVPELLTLRGAEPPSEHCHFHEGGGLQCDATALLKCML